MDVLLSRRDTVKLLVLSQLLTTSNQREIAKRLKLTPQAVSEYFKELISEGLVKSGNKYEITDKGLKWLIDQLFNIHMWTERLLKNLYSSSITAIANERIEKGDKVHYWFKDGLIYCDKSGENAIALTSADAGEEILIKPIAFKPPKRGEVLVFEVPDVTSGGSRAVDLDKLKELADGRVVTALGVEALVACRKAGLNPVFFGAINVCIESAHHGCDVLLVCVKNLVKDVIQRLMDENLSFKVLK
jgi:putative transcriptional regulator